MSNEHFTISEEILRDEKFLELRQKTMKLLRKRFRLSTKSDLRKALQFLVNLACKSTLLAQELEFYIGVLEKIDSESLKKPEEILLFRMHNQLL